MLVRAFEETARTTLTASAIKSKMVALDLSVPRLDPAGGGICFIQTWEMPAEAQVDGWLATMYERIHVLTSRRIPVCPHRHQPRPLRSCT